MFSGVEKVANFTTSKTNGRTRTKKENMSAHATLIRSPRKGKKTMIKQFYEREMSSAEWKCEKKTCWEQKAYISCRKEKHGWKSKVRLSGSGDGARRWRHFNIQPSVANSMWFQLSFFFIYTRVEVHAKPFWWSCSPASWHSCARRIHEKGGSTSFRMISGRCEFENDRNTKWIKRNEQENFVPKINLMPITLKRLEN